MATEMYAGPIGEIRAASTAGGGQALTTTADAIGLPEGARLVTLTARNLSTAVVVKFCFNPYLLILKTTDALAAAANATTYSSEAQDADVATSVTLSSLGTASDSDYLYVGSHLPFRGVDIDVDATNSTSSVLTVKYWNGSAWTDTSDTDGTISGGATMAQDGQVTWAVPSSWTADSLVDIGDVAAAIGSTIPYCNDQDIYWTRWEVSVALDSSVTLDHMLSLNRSTAYAELIAGQAFEQSITMGPTGIGCIEALTDAGTANLIVNCATRSGSSKFA